MIAMRPQLRVIAWVTTVAVMLGAQSCLAARSGPAQEYLDRLLASNAAAVQDLDDYICFPDVAADLLVRDPDGPGPALWLAGDKGFVTEGYNRAGGLMTARRLASSDEVAHGDVVLLGSLYGDDAETTELLRELLGREALVVLFAPRRPNLVMAPQPGLMSLLPERSQDVLANGYLFFDVHADPPVGHKLPTVSPALAQSLWAFTGELVTAMMRKAGRMPPIFLSVHVPNGRERNNARRGLRWDPQMAGPLPPGLAARRYLARLANCMRKLRATQTALFAQAGRSAAETLRRGNTVWLASIGHLPPSQPQQVPEDELPFKILPGVQPDRVPELVQPGDLVLYIGYYEPFGPWVEQVHEAGAKIVTVVSGTPQRSAAAMGADINICGCWPWGDTLVEFLPPRTDVTMLPPSGVIQSAVFWMLLAETRARMP